MSTNYDDKKLDALKIIYMKVASKDSNDPYGDALRAVANHCYAEGYNDGQRDDIKEGATEQYCAIFLEKKGLSNER